MIQVNATKMFTGLNQSVQSWNFAAAERRQVKSVQLCTIRWIFSMGRKCVIIGCKSNFDASKAANCKLKERNDARNSDRNKTFVFEFSSETKFPEERRWWMKAIPLFDQKTINSYETPPVVCAKLWPNDFEKKKVWEGNSVRNILRPSSTTHPRVVCHVFHLCQEQ